MKWNVAGSKVRLQQEDPVREPGRVLVASGETTRNRDWLSGKPFRIVPGGIRTRYWEAAGNLVLYMHSFDLPLGRASVYLENGKLWAPDEFEFHRKVVPVLTQNMIGDAIGTFDTGVIADLWEEKFINTVSIHVMFTPFDEQNVEETEEEVIFHTSEMIEFSIVTVPGDRHAYRQALLDYGVDEPTVKWLCNASGCYKASAQNGLLAPKAGIVVPEMTFTGSSKAVQVNLDDVFEQVTEPTPSGSGNELAEETMEDELTLESEVVEEAPAEVEAAAEPVEEETEVVQELHLEPADVAHALASDPEAVLVLAQAFASDERIHRLFADALGESLAAQLPEPVVQPRASTLRLVVQPRQAQPQPPAEEPVAEPAPARRSVRQMARPAARAAAPARVPGAKRPQKKEDKLLGLLS